MADFIQYVRMLIEVVWDLFVVGFGIVCGVLLFSGTITLSILQAVKISRRKRQWNDTWKRIEESLLLPPGQ